MGDDYSVRLLRRLTHTPLALKDTLGDKLYDAYISSMLTPFSIDEVRLMERKTLYQVSTKCGNDKTFYRFGFNGQEKDNELKGKGNVNTAEFWEYDTRFGRRWNIDPKPNVSISNYATFANNPIWFSDVAGDTVKFGDMNSSEKSAIDVWKNTKSGKNFMRDFGIGGKFEKITVKIDFGKPNEVIAGAEGLTTSYVREGDNLSDINNGEATEEQIKKVTNGAKGTNLYIEILLQRIDIKIGDYGNKNKIVPNHIYSFVKANRVSTLVHESQHARLGINSLLESKKLSSNKDDHLQMKQRDKYIKERIETLKEMRPYWQRQVMETIKQTPEKFIEENANKFID
jgi:hypothetical protein